MADFVLPTFSEDWNRWSERLARVIARTWIDEDFKNALIANPRNVLKEQGLIIPAEVQIQLEVGGTRWRIAGPGISGTKKYVIPLLDVPDNIDLEELEKLVNTQNYVPAAALPLCAVFLEDDAQSLE